MRDYWGNDIEEVIAAGVAAGHTHAKVCYGVGRCPGIVEISAAVEMARRGASPPPLRVIP